MDDALIPHNLVGICIFLSQHSFLHERSLDITALITERLLKVIVAKLSRCRKTHIASSVAMDLLARILPEEPVPRG